MKNKSNIERLFRLILVRIALSYLLFLGSSLLFFFIFKVDEAIPTLLYLIIIGSGTIWLPIALFVTVSSLALHPLRLPIKWERTFFIAASMLLLLTLGGIIFTAPEVQWQYEIYFCLLWLLSMTKYTEEYLELRQKAHQTSI
jgi:hypothetical protein